MNSVRKHLNLQGLPSIFNGLRSGYSTFNVHLRWFCWRYLFGISMSSLPSAMRPLSSPMTSMPSQFWGRNPVENGVASRLMVKGPSTTWKTCLRWRKTCISSSSWVNQNQPQKTYLQNGCIFRWKQLLLHTSLMLDGLCPGHLLGWSSKYFLTGGAKKSHSLVLLGWKWCCSTRSTFGSVFPKAVLQNHPSTLNENMRWKMKGNHPF